MMKIIVYGYGAMGKLVCQEVLSDESTAFLGAVESRADSKEERVFKSVKDIEERADVIIDFSNPVNLDEMLEYALKNKTNLVIATTGYTEEQEEKIIKASEEIAVLKAANTSLGVNLVAETLKYFVSTLVDDFDIEIIEKHHNKKVDAPSGTAKLFFDSINDSLDEKKDPVYGREGIVGKRTENEVGIHAVRGGSIVGEHTIIFAGQDEIVEVKHEALSKKIFSKGAVKAAKFMSGKEKGLYTMKEVLNLK